MRIFIATVLFVVAGATCASAQAINPEFVYGRDYTFERMEATRKVHDAEDKGTIRLRTFPSARLHLRTSSSFGRCCINRSMCRKGMLLSRETS